MYVLVMSSSFRPRLPLCQIYPKGWPCPPTGANVSLNKIMCRVNTAVLMPGILGSIITFSRSTAYTGSVVSTCYLASSLYNALAMLALTMCSVQLLHFVHIALRGLRPFFNNFSMSITGNSPNASLFMQFVNFTHFTFLLSQLSKANIHRLDNPLIGQIMNQARTVFVKVVVHFANCQLRG